MKEKLEQFITDNKLEFNAGSGGDSNILALVGYSIHIGASLQDCIEVADNSDVDSEIERVYNYAKKNNYGKWWESKVAKEQYIF
jgi:hypothetical protein